MSQTMTCNHISFDVLKVKNNINDEYICKILNNHIFINIIDFFFINSK